MNKKCSSVVLDGPPVLVEKAPKAKAPKAKAPKAKAPKAKAPESALPCPYCLSRSEYDSGLLSVVCTNCEAIGPVPEDESEFAAVNLWNERKGVINGTAAIKGRLRKCVFCDGKAEYDAEIGSVCCDDCQAVGPTADSEGEAVLFWNQRAK